MRIVEKTSEESTIVLSTEELRLIYGVLNEVRNGPNAFSDDDWAMLIGVPREVESALLQSLDSIFNVE